MLRRSRRSGTSSQHKKGSQVEIPLKNNDRAQPTVISKFTESDAKKDRPNEESKMLLRERTNEKMTLYGNFVIYLAATSFLIDDFTYAYQISSTNFDGLSHSVLFSGNIHRLKALSAEQIFLQYFDPKEPENSFPVMAYLVEAI